VCQTRVACCGNERPEETLLQFTLFVLIERRIRTHVHHKTMRTSRSGPVFSSLPSSVLLLVVTREGEVRWTEIISGVVVVF
jgi:hypothetical protein